MPEIYSEPRRFMPQRWETIQPTAYEYFPFGAGSRMCIGATFAMMEIKIVLAMLLQRYRLALVPQAKIKRKNIVTLGVDGNMPMVVHPQDKAFDKSKVSFRGTVRQMVDWA
jgi:cytochrome P450